MRSKILPEHFVAFLTVCGFFLGLIFCVLSIEKAFDIIVFTILIMDLEKKEGKSEHILKAIEMEREELKKSEVKEKRRKDGSKNAA